VRRASQAAVLLLALTVAGCSFGDGGEPPDSDRDGIADALDNAPRLANAPRIDLDGDGILGAADQLDNDGDGTADELDPDDDGDGLGDNVDVCPLTPDADQLDADRDERGDACDPLAETDGDGDGVLDGPPPGHPLHEAAKAAKAKWSSGTTRFVLRIDALSRFFQNEFTQLMTDAAVLSPSDWRLKCTENYEDPDDPPDPCPGLPGAKRVAITLVTIPNRIWLDPGVVAWINDRNDDPLLEIAQHGTYHADNTRRGDWRVLADRREYACEICGLSEREAFALLKTGRDTLVGAYDTPRLRAAGATRSSPRIDWSSSAHPLLTFAPPFNTSDAHGRQAVAELGFRAFSASVHEEEGHYSRVFTPEGTHHERFDQFGLFHVSADVQVDPPEIEGDTYDRTEYDEYLRSQTNHGGLTTWLIEEVEWSGRPCNDEDRLGSCAGKSNRENNTVFRPRWDAWLQLLDFVRSYPGGVVLTSGEVALALAYDNAPAVANPAQADADHDGVGDAAERR
jgi:hypothetical protein